MCSRPLGSPTRWSKRSYVHVPRVVAWCRHVACSGVWVPGGVWLGGYWVGIPGEYYPAIPREEPSPQTAERAPEAPAWGWSGWSEGWVDACPRYHPAGPVGQPGLPVPGTRSHAASWPIRARFQSYFYKVSQNHGVSPKYVQKA